MFGTLHIIALCASLVFIVIATWLTLKIPFEKVARIMLVIGLAAELVKLFAYTLMNEKTLGGYLPKTDLPLHLCSFQVIFMAILVFAKNENLKRIIRSFMLPTCLVGGLAAILIPTSSSVSSLNVITFEYFGYHAAIMVFSLRMILGSDVEFTVRDYASCLTVLLLTMFCAMYINSILYNGTADGNFVYEVTDGEHVGTVQLTVINFMYTADPPVSGLPFLNETHGWAVYIVHYMFTCLLAITLVYIGPIIRAIKGRKARAQA